MSRKYVKLEGVEAAAQVNAWLRHNRHAAVRDRLLALQMAFTGEYSYAQICERVGRARAAVQQWFKWYRQEGLEGVLGHRYGAGKPKARLLDEEVESILREGLQAGRWRTVKEAVEELERRTGRRLPMRPDHGHMIGWDQGRGMQAGYPYIGRLRGLAELRGVAAALEAVRA